MKLNRFTSNKILQIVPAQLQGFQANLQHYCKKAVCTDDNVQYRPLFFVDGKRLEFHRASDINDELMHRSGGNNANRPAGGPTGSGATVWTTSASPMDPAANNNKSGPVVVSGISSGSASASSSRRTGRYLTATPGGATPNSGVVYSMGSNRSPAQNQSIPASIAAPLTTTASIVGSKACYYAPRTVAAVPGIEASSAPYVANNFPSSQDASATIVVDTHLNGNNNTASTSDSKQEDGSNSGGGHINANLISSQVSGGSDSSSAAGRGFNSATLVESEQIIIASASKLVDEVDDDDAYEHPSAAVVAAPQAEQQQPTTTTAAEENAA